MYQVIFLFSVTILCCVSLLPTTVFAQTTISTAEFTSTTKSPFSLSTSSITTLHPEINSTATYSNNATTIYVGSLNTSFLSITSATGTTQYLKPTPATQPDPFQNLSRINDDFTYYTSIIYMKGNVPDSFVQDLQAQLSSNVKRPRVLQNNINWAVQIPMSFQMKFYGHLVNNATIAIPGYIYLNNFLHPYLSYTQYVAPFMAHFTTQGNMNASITYKDSGTAFYVSWENMLLAGKPQVGTFTFQVALYKNGTIFFYYPKLPIKPVDVNDPVNPVKVGLSDGYYQDRLVNGLLRRTIFSYHVIAINQSAIREGSAVLFTPQPTCVERTSCSECLSPIERFKCQWCPEMKVCSSGVDRNRDAWMDMQCHNKAVSSECPVVRGINGVAVFFIILACIALGAAALWFLYAYKYPTSPSGLWLIQHRPRVLWERCCRKGGDRGESYSVGFGTSYA